MNLSNIIPWPRRDHIGEELAAALELVEIDNRTLLDRAASATDQVLEQARDEIYRQDMIIAEATEARRQAQIVIAAFEPAQKHLVDGIDPPQAVRKGKKPVLQAAE